MLKYFGFDERIKRCLKLLQKWKTMTVVIDENVRREISNLKQVLSKEDLLIAIRTFLFLESNRATGTIGRSADRLIRQIHSRIGPLTMAWVCTPVSENQSGYAVLKLDAGKDWHFYVVEWWAYGAKPAKLLRNHLAVAKSVHPPTYNKIVDLLVYEQLK